VDRWWGWDLSYHYFRAGQRRRRNLRVIGRNVSPFDPPALPEGPPGPTNFPGEPPTGKLYVGVRESAGDNVVTRYETPAGAVLGVHRMFFQTSQSDATMAAVCEAELAAGRLPWMSFKTPTPWSTVTQSYLENRIGVIADITSGPVWLTVWHEPENDLTGGNTIADWLTMQENTRAALDNLAPHNIVFAPVFMSFTWNPASGRDPDDWWTPDAGWDFVGVDAYNSDPEPLHDLPPWPAILAWVDAHDLKLGLGEWGIDPVVSSASKHIYMQQTWDDLVAETSPHIICAAYYDSSAAEDWRLSSTGQGLAKFRELMADANAYHYTD